MTTTKISVGKHIITICSTWGGRFMGSAISKIYHDGILVFNKKGVGGEHFYSFKVKEQKKEALYEIHINFYNFLTGWTIFDPIKIIVSRNGEKIYSGNL